jgi:PleD family two-component response regulator
MSPVFITISVGVEEAHPHRNVLYEGLIRTDLLLVRSLKKDERKQMLIVDD